MNYRCANERQEKIDALTIRYTCGEISTTVYETSLGILIRDKSEVRHLIGLNWQAHENSIAFRRGDFRS